ncbi:group II intron reverse transcriptase/maturase [Enterococcus sp. DIV0756]|uniref:group II intron reverse transcriptase/maturase n=1 Tax=Enterococcus sp. DIV0756 TaxID=2774636 RepID=UPI003F224335
MNVRNMTNTMLKQKVDAFGQVLYQCAKEQPNRKFHALYDKIYRPDVLKLAWLKVQANQGSGGIDGKTIDYIVDTIGERQFLNDLYVKLKQEKYVPQPVRRVYIPKGNGETRPLGIPVIEDRVVQQATKLVMEPIFEVDFKDCSYGFRPKRNAHQALKVIRKESKTKYWVVDVDIKGYFDNISHQKLMQLVEQRISDRRLLALIRQWLKAGVMEGKEFHESTVGSPQGGVISPLLANIYLNYLDTLWEKHCSHLGTLIRYADDMVIMCKRKGMALESIRSLKGIFEKLELEMNTEKSRLVNLWDDSEGFDFLGFHHRKFPKRRKHGKVIYTLEHVPSKKAMKKMRQTFKATISPRNKLYLDTLDFVEGLNRKIVGMRNYYFTTPLSRKWLAKIDWYIRDLLIIHYNTKRQKFKYRNRKVVVSLLEGKLKKLAAD